MRMLVLGGTRFVGLHIVQEALRRGHDVTVFHRGRTPAPDGAHALIGDRDGDLSALDEGSWDAVVDVSGYLPRQVRSAAERLQGRVGRYLFISSCAVYAERDRPELDVGSPLHTLDDPATETIDGSTYGGLKVLCEREAERAFPGRHLSLRPTYVVGPNDLTDRFNAWLRRVRRGGELVAPIDADLPMAFIDVRDLARFTVDQAGGDATGAVNMSGPAGPTTWGRVLQEAARVTGAQIEPRWVSLALLEELGLRERALPMVTPFGFRGGAPYAVERAVELGLRHTTLEATVFDTLAWDDAEGQPRQGLSPEEERRVLDAWRERTDRNA